MLQISFKCQSWSVRRTKSDEDDQKMTISNTARGSPKLGPGDARKLESRHPLKVRMQVPVRISAAMDGCEQPGRLW